MSTPLSVAVYCGRLGNFKPKGFVPKPPPSVLVKVVEPEPEPVAPPVPVEIDVAKPIAMPTVKWSRSERGKIGPSLALIRYEVVVACGVTMAEFVSKSRLLNFVHARHIYFYLARDLTDMSLNQIGALAGHRDHTTVYHGVNNIAAAVARDVEFAVKVGTIKAAILAAYEQAIAPSNSENSDADRAAVDAT